MFNLKEMFPQFKITYDPVCTDKRDPSMMQIPCRKGLIYMHGERIFALECKTYTARQLVEMFPDKIVRHHVSGVERKVSGVRVWQEGDSEWTLLFGYDLFEHVADVVRPRKRRILSEQQKAAQIERLKKYQFQ